MVSRIHDFDQLVYEQEDRENVLRARASGKGVLTAPFRLLKSNRLGVILTFAVYKTDIPSNATPDERIQATDGYISDDESQFIGKREIYKYIYTHTYTYTHTHTQTCITHQLGMIRPSEETHKRYKIKVNK